MELIFIISLILPLFSPFFYIITDYITVLIINLFIFLKKILIIKKLKIE